MLSIRHLLAVTLFATLSMQLQAQPPAPVAAGKRILATRISGESPRIDGRLDDPVWKNAQYVSNFIQKEPNEGAEPSERTEVAFIYDDDALYIGARMYSKDPSAIQALVTRRDNSGASERLIVALDTYHDKRTAYSFSITASGVRTDYYHPSDQEYSRDYSFDPVWEAHTVIDSAGWTAEMRIPFSQLRFNDLDQQIWGVNMDRYIPSKNEDIYWIPIPKDGTGWASRFADLEGISGIRPSRRVELLPYVAGGARLTSLHDPNDPFSSGTDLNARAGLDAKMGLGSNLTLDATVNPDFGQVEADPAEVNLSAFETFFSERRPFFVEGSQLLKGTGPAYFYSRRIGAAPHGDVAGDFIDSPGNSTILGAAKLTGRLPSGLSIGGLAAVTEREHARFYNLDTKTIGEQEVEPATGFGVLRVQQEFGPSASTVGGMVTAVRRDLSSGDPLANLLPRQAVTGGSDWTLRFAEGEYQLDGYVGGSYVAGDPAAMINVQTASAHYFQRPDADYLGVDSNRRSLAGYTGGLTFQRMSGEHWLWGAQAYMESPGFDLNDAGQLGSADDIATYATLTYRETIPGTLTHNWSATSAFNAGWNFGGASTYRNLNLIWNATLNNYWSTSISLLLSDRSLSDDLARGGPMMAVPKSVYGAVALNSDYATNVRWSGGGGLSADELSGWNASIYGGFEADIGDRLEVAINPQYSRVVDNQQYVATATNGHPATFGNRYIFSTIDRTTLSAQIRINYTITPDLSVEAYAEPYVASGRYTHFGELASPGSLHLRYYGTDGTAIGNLPNGDYVFFDGPDAYSFPNPNFNALFFRSNLVLRWEWRPGSTLYLVWQQDRAGFDNRGEHVRPGDLWKSITTDGDQFLTLKASYWLPIE